MPSSPRVRFYFLFLKVPEWLAVWEARLGNGEPMEPARTLCSQPLAWGCGWQWQVGRVMPPEDG